MDLTSDHPFWFVRNGLIRSYPPLSGDLTCDVAVVGAGITGSMIAHRLSRMGMDVVVLDRRDVCTGSTSASTALLQYEIDVSLVEMAKIIGQENASRAYRISHRSIDDLTSLVEELKTDCGFGRRTSIYLASGRRAAKEIADEARARRAIGLDVEYHDHKSLDSTFGLPGVAALSSEQAACCDAYRLAHALLKSAQVQGARIYDRTDVTNFRFPEKGVELATDRGHAVTARRMVVATGYESQELLREKVVDLDNTYALVSQPLDDLGPWNENWILWEAKNPYLYLRITEDRRLLVGGEDDAFHSPKRRDASISHKSKTIESKVRELLPGLKWETEFAWAGTFGKTRDGLAYIGPTDEFPNCLFALGFGGNGITFSSIATQIIADQITGTPNEDANLFRFGR